MANKKHLEILKKGVKAWNEWRENNPEEKPNLIEADLSGADLREVNLVEADLTLTHLSFASLFKANFSRTLCYFTNFHQTELFETNFSNSTFMSVKITNCDLSTALGLTKIIHRGPSSIGIDTILKSKDEIPISFLKNCDVPIAAIGDILSIFREDYYKCFISYSSKDKIFTEKLKTDLELNNIRCWFFPDDAVLGKDIEENIDEAMKIYDKVIVVCSEDSLNSEPVLREIDRALEKENALKEKHKQTKRILFPIVIDDYFYKGWDHPLKPLIKRIVYGDFRNWKNPDEYKKAFEKSLKGLQK